MSLRWQHCNETNKKHKFIELDGSESKCFVKFAAYEKIIYNTDVSYFLWAEWILWQGST